MEYRTVSTVLRWFSTDESLVADAGLLAAGTLVDRLGLEDLVDGTVRLGGRVGGANPGRKVTDFGVRDAGGRFPYRPC